MYCIILFSISVYSLMYIACYTLVIWRFRYCMHHLANTHTHARACIIRLLLPYVLFRSRLDVVFPIIKPLIKLIEHSSHSNFVYETENGQNQTVRMLLIGVFCRFIKTIVHTQQHQQQQHRLIHSKSRHTLTEQSVNHDIGITIFPMNFIGFNLQSVWVI